MNTQEPAVAARRPDERVHVLARLAFAWAGLALVVPDAMAQFGAGAFHNFETRGPNSLGFAVGARVELGAFGPSGISGTAARPAQCAFAPAPAMLVLDNLAFQNIPTQAYGSYPVPDFAGICAGSWLLTLNALGSQITLPTPTLAGVQIVPFVSNNSISSSADGKVHTFRWSSAAGVDSVRLNFWDRSLLPTGGAPQLVRSLDFGAITSHTIDLDEPATPFGTGRPYTLEVSLIDTRDNAVAQRTNGNMLSRSRTYFDFTLPATPATTEPVFLPIVEFVAGDPTYVFSITVDGAGTFIIDPEIAVGYIFATAAGNPNFRTVKLPNVGDGRYVVEVFDAGANRYVSPIAALAGVTYDFTALGFPLGVSKFRVKGIETSAGLDAANPMAFQTALQFTGDGVFTGTMVPITRYATSGFLPPVNVAPTLNTSRAGSTLPFKWTLADREGYLTTDLNAVASIGYKPTSCASFTTDPAGAVQALTAGGSVLRNDPSRGQFLFNWKTPQAAGCYTFFVTTDTQQVVTANVMLTN